MSVTRLDTVDLSEVIEAQRLTGFILKLVAVSVLVTFFDGYDMQGIAYVAPYLQPAFHLDRLMLGNIFSAGIAGNFIGAMAIGWLGDYFGRRPAIVWSTVAFGVLTCAQALSQTYEQFLILRFIDGIAIGGMIPVCWALNIEYAPKRFRSTIVTIVMVGYTIGASAAGPIAVWFIPRFGWQSSFLFGGIGSLLAGALLYFTLPESIRFLCAKAGNRDMIAGTIR
ncbi:MAG TPA: MFS transporter, partial [Actinobacteria bacterium]|nr:MFS transporter [Actinomycetota bacterium]